MKVAGVLFLTLSAATPASSVFVIVPGVVQAAGSGALIAMALAGVVALCMALTYAELGSRHPSAGGEYAIVGHALGPSFGFAMLGVNLMNLVLASAALSLGVADYLGALAPGLQPVPTALAVMAAATALGVLNIRTSAAVTGAFLVVELAALAAVTALGFAHPARGLGEVLLHPVSEISAHGALGPVGLGALATGAVVGLFAYDGYGSAIYLSEEVLDVRRRLVRAVLWALGVTAAAEMLSLAAVLTGAPSLPRLFAGGDGMISAFAAERGGRAFAAAMSGGVALAILNAVIALVLMTARQLYATARDGAWPAPANHALTRVSARFGSPWAATLLAGGVGAALCFVPLDRLLILSGSSVSLIYAGLCIASLRSGRRARVASDGWRMPLWPAPPLLALGLIGLVTVTSLKDSAISLGVSITAGAVAALYHAAVLRRRGGWSLRGPQVD
ncbi:APC family permease [soil metagenome]